MTRLRQKPATAGKPASKKKCLPRRTRLPRVPAPNYETLKNRLSVAITDLTNMRQSLRDLLALYDRVAESSGGHGWTAADVKRLDEIRKLCSS